METDNSINKVRIVLIGFIVTISIILLVFSILSLIPIDSVPATKDTFRDTFANTTGPCGDLTKLSGTECIPDDESIIKYLVSGKFLTVSKTSERIAIGLDTKITPLEPWQTKWQTYGSNCTRTPPADGWDPSIAGPTKTIGYVLSKPQIACSDNTCYVNGLCVSPYESGSGCCPDCAFASPGDGGCAGKILCDGTLCSGTRTKTEYPDTVVLCGTNPTIAPMCLSGISKGDCWSPTHEDPFRRAPYASWNDSCKEVSLCDAGSGANQFECAIGCTAYPGDVAKTQRECSKKCFPKMWKWYTMVRDGIPVGVWQGDVLWNMGDPSPNYCPGSGCTYTRDLGAQPEANGCSNCDKCNNLMELNGKIGNYYCDSCEKCKINISPIDTGDCGDLPKEVTCSNLNRCTGCQKNKYNLFGTLSNNTCGQCVVPPGNGGCSFYTKRPYEIVGGIAKLREGATTFQT